MPINFPSSLDSLTNPAGSDKQDNPSHSSQHSKANDILEALEAKVGVDSSADTTSLDYKINNIVTAITGEYNIMDYGATGDGLTDDTQAIEDTISAANADGGGIVRVPKGTYIISNCISLATNVILKGIGDALSIIKLSNGANCSMVDMSAFSYSGTFNIQFDGNKANQTNPNLSVLTTNIDQITGENNIFVVNCMIKDGVKVGVDFAGSRRYWILNNTFSGIGTTSIRLHGGEDCKVIGNVIWGYGNPHVCIRADSRYSLIDGNTCYIDSADSSCILLEDDGAAGARKSKVVNNHCGMDTETVTKYGFGVLDYTTYGNSNVIANNTFYNLTQGCRITNSNGTYVGNTINTVDTGFYITDDALTGLVISGNSIQSAGVGIDCYGSQVSITGNNFRTGSYGVLERTGANYNIILGNTFNSMGTAVTKIGANTVYEHNVIV